MCTLHFCRLMTLTCTLTSRYSHVHSRSLQYTWYTYIHSCMLYVPVHSCILLFTLVYLFMLMLTIVYPCELTFTLVHSCLPLYTHVPLCTPKSTHVHPCTLIFTLVTLVFMFTHIHSCSPSYTDSCTLEFTHVATLLLLLFHIATLNMYTKVQQHS